MKFRPFTKSIPQNVLKATLSACFLASVTTAQAKCISEPSTAITVTPDIPCEIDDPSNLAHAANFAWNEFIALTWPALAQGPTSFPRGLPKTDSPYGTRGPSGHVVWETYRHRVEAFPGQGEPNGYDANAPDFGFSAKPEYVYKANSFLGIPADGLIPPYQGITEPAVPPFHNLDEGTQIVLNAMYAGVVDPDPMLGGSLKTNLKEKILYEAKINQAIYSYVVKRQGPAGDQFAYYESEKVQVSDIKNRSSGFLRSGDSTMFPPPYINLPASNPGGAEQGSIEIKAAFRRINTDVEDPNRFYQAPVRYYVGKEEFGLGKIEGYVDSGQVPNEIWGLVALHIIHKTPNAPSFVYATFGHIDNILAVDGASVEEPDGTTKPEFLPLPPFSAELTIKESTQLGAQQQAIMGARTANTNTRQLYYHNLNNKAVIEDPSTKTKIFSAPTQFEVELSRGFIPDALRGLFSENGITTIPANPTNPDFRPPVENLSPVATPNSEWRILDTRNKNRTYRIENNNTELNVYEVSLFKGPVNVNRRIYPIPPTITAANRAAHAAIGAGNVWQNYRLVNVQARPLDLDAIPSGEEPTYFLANEIVETNTSLQRFTGSIQGSITGRITDYRFDKTVGGQAAYKKVNNMFVVTNGVPKGFNMGGCMGCHGGQGQTQGGDFSVLLANGRITFPDIIQADEEQSEELMRRNMLKYFKELRENP